MSAPVFFINEERGEAICPSCRSCEIYEVDRAVRWNRLGSVTKAGAIASVGQGDFEHEGYICGACLKTLTEPADFWLDWG